MACLQCESKLIFKLIFPFRSLAKDWYASGTNNDWRSLRALNPFRPLYHHLNTLYHSLNVDQQDDV